MRRFFAACVALASFFGAGAASADTLAITHIDVIDATGAPPQRDMTIIVRMGASPNSVRAMRCMRLPMRRPWTARANT